jgi:hypothetical protein
MSTQDPTFKYADNMPGLAPAPTNYYDEYLKNFEASLNPEYDRSGNRQAASTAARTTGLKGLYEYIMNPNGQYTADQAGAFFQELLGGLSDNTYASNRAQQANGYYGVTNDAWAASEAERNTLLQKAFGVDPTDILAQARQNSNNRALTQEGLTGAINANRQLYSSLLSNVSDPTKLDKSALQQLFQMAGLGTQQQSALSKMQAQKYDATQAAKQQALQQQNTQNLLNSYAKSSGISSPLTAMSFG